MALYLEAGTGGQDVNPPAALATLELSETPVRRPCARSDRLHRRDGLHSSARR